MLEKCKCEIKKKYIKKNYKKMERKKMMSWMLTWLNVSAAALNATFQLLVIYRFDNASTLYLYLPDLLLKFSLDRCPYMYAIIELYKFLVFFFVRGRLFIFGFGFLRSYYLF